MKWLTATALLLTMSCTNLDTQDVYRGTENGLVIQKVVSVFSTSGAKDDISISKWTYNKRRKRWDPLGPERLISEASAASEVSNLQKYNGDEFDPPSAGITIPQYIYMANNAGQNAIVILDASTLSQVRRIPVASFMPAIEASPDGLSVVFIMSIGGGAQLRQIDVLTNTIVRTLTLPAGANPNSIRFSPDGARIYVADASQGIFIVDPKTLTLTQTVARPSNVSGFVSSTISPDGDILIARSFGSAPLAILDLTTLTWTGGFNPGRAVLLGNIPCVFHPTGKEFYCITTDGVGVFDTVTMSNVATVSIPRGEILTRLHPFDGGNYLLLSTDKFIRLIDTAARTIEPVLPAPSNILEIRAAFPVREF